LLIISSINIKLNAVAHREFHESIYKQSIFRPQNNRASLSPLGPSLLAADQRPQNDLTCTVKTCRSYIPYTFHICLHITKCQIYIIEFVIDVGPIIQ